MLQGHYPCRLREGREEKDECRLLFFPLPSILPPYSSALPSHTQEMGPSQQLSSRTCVLLRWDCSSPKTHPAFSPAAPTNPPANNRRLEKFGAFISLNIPLLDSWHHASPSPEMPRSGCSTDTNQHSRDTHHTQEPGHGTMSWSCSCSTTTGKGNPNPPGWDASPCSIASSGWCFWQFISLNSSMDCGEVTGLPSHWIAED